MTAMNDDTPDLINRYRSGDPDAATAIFEKYVSRLISVVHRRMSSRLGRRVDAEDVVQSAFRSFFVGMDKDRFEFDEAGDLWRLLVVMSLNKLRRKAAHHGAAKRGMSAEQSINHTNRQGEAVCFETAASEPLPDAAAAMMDELENLTDGFDERQVRILRLRLHGYQMTEIADEMQCSERTIRRALEKVRQRWEERLEQFSS